MDNNKTNETRCYKHASGLDFDLGLIAGTDLTAVMLWATPADDEPYEEGCHFVDYSWGWPSELEDQQLDDMIDNWLDRQSAEDIQKWLKWQTEAH